METPKFVKYIGEEEYGLKYGDIVKVLSGTSSNRLYVECPEETSYCGSSATNPENLKGKNFNLVDRDEYELVEETKKYVKFIGHGDGDGAGLKYGDIVEVLSTNNLFNDFLYVKTPLMNTRWTGGNATNKKALEGQNFTYLSNTEYEIIPENETIKEKKKMDKQTFKVGDIVKGNADSSREYTCTNANMTKGIVTKVNGDGNFGIEILEHTDKGMIGKPFFNLHPEFFTLVSEPISPYHITTDMATYVEIEHNDVKAKSKCDVRYDKFDIHTGINIAMERLVEAEKPEPPKPEIPKYVMYTGKNGKRHGLTKGDICKVYTNGDYCPSNLYVSSKETDVMGDCAVDRKALDGKTFTYLQSGEYKPVDFNIYE